MFDLPLHPVVVHMPIALAVLMPLIAFTVTLLFWKRGPTVRQWALVPILSAVLLGSSWVALETGEQDEEIVETVVDESLIEAHEEAAEWFMFGVGALFLISLGGFVPRYGFRKAASLATVVASVGVLGLGINVGHKGGELVYRHGASQAHVDRAGAAVSSTGVSDEDRDDDERHDD